MSELVGFDTVRGKLELEAASTTLAVDRVIEISHAISAKREADALERIALMLEHIFDGFARGLIHDRQQLMASQPLDEDREEVLKQELRQLFEQLDEIDRCRAQLMLRIQAGTKEMAKARGVPFMRLEHVRKECS